ncbi:GntR family transcriptional regulator [Pseudomonadota bacterium]
MIANGKIVSVREQIANQLRSDIISGDLAPDSKLNEQALADRFGVSRGPIRDVLLQLSKEGLLVTRANVGASVNTMLSPQLQQLMVDIRRRIELFAARQLKGKMSEEDFSNLEDILKRFEDSFLEEDFTEVTKADISFHRYLVEKAGGEDLINLWYPVALRMRMNYKRLDDAAHGVEEHRSILESLRKDDISGLVAALRVNIR